MLFVRAAFILSGVALFMSGCDTVRNALDLEHYQANAFETPTNPPLVLPPEYNLRPPAPGAGPTYAQAAPAQAQKTLNISQGQTYSGTQSEKGLMRQVSGSSSAPSDIRTLVDKEAEQENTLAGQMSKQVSDWKAEAKKNFYSISGDTETKKLEEVKENSPKQAPLNTPSTAHAGTS